MPMKLRMLSEKVYGYTPGGICAPYVLAQNVVVEAGLCQGINLGNVSGVISHVKGYGDARRARSRVLML